MPTELLFHYDSYLKSCDARVIALTENGGIVLDRTVFYATSGGQPGDSGMLTNTKGALIPIATAAYTDASKSEIAHLPTPGAPPLAVGDTVSASIDWSKRHARMRMHTALHLLSAVLPHPVTGGSVGDGEGRLDFDIPEAGLDKDVINEKLAELVAVDAPVTTCWISQSELEANPGLVKTKDAAPPSGNGKVRLISIAGVDLQPCGGTHVRSTAEIEPIHGTQIEKKGKQNRRVRLAFA
jgi:misacylated tRNA(Ala) deacylase